MVGVPHLKELSAKYRERGFEILACTNEDPAKVEEWLKKNVVNYGVVSKAPGVSTYISMGTGVPRGWVISADGKIAFSGKPADITGAMVEEWLKDCPASKIEKKLSRELNAAVTYYNTGKLGKALAEAEKHEASEKTEVAADASFVAEKVRKAMGWRKDEAKRYREEGEWLKLAALLEEDARTYDGVSYAEDCAAEAKTVKASPEFKTASAAHEMLSRIKARKDLKGDALVRELEKVIAKYPETPAGKEAAAMKSKAEAPIAGPAKGK
ncbi:hypothetical protein PLCT1_01220 [Planctomycetaceae bacterium]|nr:hypothetical protein PLCT1_01220 [Planctomycetaceae bacterium]